MMPASVYNQRKRYELLKAAPWKPTYPISEDDLDSNEATVKYLNTYQTDANVCKFIKRDSRHKLWT